MFDFSVYDGGSVCLLTPHSDAAQQWVAENVEGDRIRFDESPVCVERRYIEDICVGILFDELTIEKDGLSMRRTLDNQLILEQTHRQD